MQTLLRLSGHEETDTELAQRSTALEAAKMFDSKYALTYETPLPDKLITTILVSCCFRRCRQKYDLQDAWSATNPSRPPKALGMDADDWADYIRDHSNAPSPISPSTTGDVDELVHHDQAGSLHTNSVSEDLQLGITTFPSLQLMSTLTQHSANVIVMQA